MKCPSCDYDDSKVIDSRSVENGIRRRRECLECSFRFTTYERIQPPSLFVVKKDQRREEFDRNKLLVGVRRACEKRPMPAGTVDKLVDDIEFELYHTNRAEVSSVEIGDLVMERLKKLDYIAYIRFASVYRQFTDITDLKQAVDSLVSNESEKASPAGQLPLLATEDLAGLSKQSRRRQK